MNSQAVYASHTGMIILGGGLIKHHICNANLMVGIFLHKEVLGAVIIFMVTNFCWFCE